MIVYNHQYTLITQFNMATSPPPSRHIIVGQYDVTRYDEPADDAVVAAGVVATIISACMDVVVIHGFTPAHGAAFDAAGLEGWHTPTGSESPASIAIYWKPDTMRLVPYTSEAVNVAGSEDVTDACLICSGLTHLLSARRFMVGGVFSGLDTGVPIRQAATRLLHWAQNSSSCGAVLMASTGQPAGADMLVDDGRVGVGPVPPFAPTYPDTRMSSNILLHGSAWHPCDAVTHEEEEEGFMQPWQAVTLTFIDDTPTSG
jgi:hypothetical protein